MFDSTADIVAFMDEKGLPYNLLKTLSAMFPKQLSMREIQCAVDLVLRRKEESPVAVDTVLCMMSKCSSKIHVPYSNGDGQWFAQVLADANFHLGVNQLDASGFVSVGLVLFMFGKANKVTNEMVKELKDQLALKYSRQNIDDGKELYAKQRYSSALMDMVVERRLREYREQQTSV